MYLRCENVFGGRQSDDVGDDDVVQDECQTRRRGLDGSNDARRGGKGGRR